MIPRANLTIPREKNRKHPVTHAQWIAAICRVHRPAPAKLEHLHKIILGLVRPSGGLAFLKLKRF